MARVKKVWSLLAHDTAAIDRLARELRTSPIVAQLLINRNIRTPEAARSFLNPSLSGLHEPELLPGVLEAAQRLLKAIEEQRTICIYGDYDVDGVSGSAILLRALQLLGGKVEFHVPHRVEDGYGLSISALKQIARSGVSVVVTVDCGIANLAEAEEARRLGLELIVTDHHEFKSELPAASVLVHPRLPGSDYPFGGLSGAGVAFKLAWAVCKLASGGERVTPRLRDFLMEAIALAALGAVADVMPLHDENRLFVRYGLARLKENPTPGLKAILQSARLDAKQVITAMDIGFTLAPRLNAAGRLGSARVAVELLTTPSLELAEDYARHLEELNQQRQSLERQMLSDAREFVESDGHLQQPALVLARSKWHLGLIGIVAGRLTDLYGRPALMISLDQKENLAIGSGRSVPGFKLHEALEACSTHLLAHGGHAAAAGFRLRPTAVQRFQEKFREFAAQHFGPQAPEPVLKIDAEVALSTLTVALVEQMAALEPYGQGNPQPLFLAGGLQVYGEPRLVGGDRHLSFKVRQGRNDFKAIAFNMADRLQELMSCEGKCCLVFTPRINDWQGYRSVELHVRDLQAGPIAKLG